MRIQGLLVLIVAVLPTWATAQPLVDKVSSQAIVYAGWAGSDHLSGFDDSHAKALLDASNFSAVFSDLLPRVADRVAQDDPAVADAIRVSSTLAEALWKYPTAIAFYGVTFEGNGAPEPQFQIIAGAGDQAAALAEQVQALLEGGPASIQVTHEDGLFLLTSGSVPQGNTLSAAPRFQAAMAQVQANPAAILYVDGPGLVAMIDSLVDQSAGPQDAETWGKVRDALAVEEIQGLIATGGFEDRKWSSRAFLAAPAPRRGLAAVLEGKPLGDEIFGQIPASSTYVGSYSIDLAAMVQQVRTVLQEVDPQLAQQMDQALGMATAIVGANVEKDLIGALGNEWAFYTSPQVGGTGMLGMTIINRLTEPAKAERSLGQLETAINAMIAGQRRRQSDPVIQFRMESVDGTTLHYLAVPAVAPAWTVKDGRLYMALYPQIALAATRVEEGGGQTILQNEQFVELRDRLSGGHPVSGVDYYNLPALTGSSYPLLLAIARIPLGFADMFGIEAPIFVLPPLDVLQAHVTPSMSVMWSDDAGLHMRAESPFPGSKILSLQADNFIGQMLASAPAIILPSLQRARENANRIKSAANLRMIGQGLMLYAMDDRSGKYPPDLQTLLRTVELPPEVLDSPLGDAVDGQDYVYLYFDGLNNTAGADLIVAYDAASLESGEGTNGLFGDGHVQWMTPESFRSAVEHSRRHYPKSAPREILGF